MFAVLVDWEYVQNCKKKANGNKKTNRFMLKGTKEEELWFLKET
jgi:hypothetical protein